MKFCGVKQLMACRVHSDSNGRSGTTKAEVPLLVLVPPAVEEKDLVLKVI